MTNNPKDEPIFIIGHLNPDTDSVCSAIAYANFLKEKKGRSDIIAACAGHLNDETKFALKYFHQKQPHHLQAAAGKNLIIVDHNELSLSLPDIKEANRILSKRSDEMEKETWKEFLNILEGQDYTNAPSYISHRVTPDGKGGEDTTSFDDWFDGAK